MTGFFDTQQGKFLLDLFYKQKMGEKILTRFLKNAQNFLNEYEGTLVGRKNNE